MFKKLLLTSAMALTTITFSSMLHAADFGGDCCADLEERVAVLEATTARKGNRKVSLTISGWVTQQLMGWDDSIDSDVYVGTSLNDLATRINFAGSAKIDSNWSAGYLIQLSIKTDDGFTQNALNDDGAGDAIAIEHNYMWIKSEQLGTLRWGRQSQASDDNWVDLSGAGSIFAANLVIFDGQGFNLIGKGTNTRSNATWGNIGFCHSVGVGIFNDCSGDRTDNIRYDSPTIAGFVLSTSWGEDDFWDVALRHTGEFGDFKTAFGVAYSWNDDDRVGTLTTTTLAQVNFAILHQPTGLFANVHYGYEDPDAANIPEGDHLYVKAGIRSKLNSWGSTVFYGEYGLVNDGFNDISDLDPNTAGVQTLGTELGVGTVTGSESERYGVGIVQEIDAAAMALWIKWKHHEGEVEGTTGTVDVEDLDIFAFGGAIFF